MFSASAFPAAVAPGLQPPYLKLEDGSVDACPTESDYSMENELEPQLMPSSGSEVENSPNDMRSTGMQATGSGFLSLKKPYRRRGVPT